MTDRPPNCPRCEYNLSGQDHAAARVICPECGLEVVWADWDAASIRYAHTALESPIATPLRSFVVTTLKLLFPGRLWATLRMDQPVRVKRLVAFAALHILAVWVVLVVSGVGMAERFARSSPKVVPYMFASPDSASAFGPRGLPAPPVTQTPTRAQLAALEQSILSGPGWYFLPNSVPSSWVHGDLKRWAASQRLTLRAQPDVDAWIVSISSAFPVFDAACEQEIERIGGVLHRRMILNPWFLVTVNVHSRENLPVYTHPLWILAAANTLMPLSFLLIPGTFRLAKVRRVHLVRALAYTVAPPLWMVAAISAASDAVARWHPYRYAVRDAVMAAVAVFTVWGTLWFFRSWWVYLRRYLRFERALLPLVLLPAVCVLLALLAMVGLEASGTRI